MTGGNRVKKALIYRFPVTKTFSNCFSPSRKQIFTVNLSACTQIHMIFPRKMGCIAQSITCLATDASLTADPGGREFDPGPVPYFRGD